MKLAGLAVLFTVIFVVFAFCSIRVYPKMEEMQGAGSLWVVTTLVGAFAGTLAIYFIAAVVTGMTLEQVFPRS